MGQYLVHAGFSLKAILPKAGGQAVRLVPATAQEIQTYRGRKPAGYQDVIAVYPDTDPPVTGIRPDAAHPRGIAMAEAGGLADAARLLPPGTRSWKLFSMSGVLIASGDRTHTRLSGMRAGLYIAEADLPGGPLRFRILVRD
jgi:hypothetical protein